MKHKNKDIKIFLGNLLIFLCIFSQGYFLSDGWSRIDGSYFRDYLYFVLFFVIPLDLIFLIYLFLKLIIDKSVIKKSLLFGVVLGFAVSLFILFYLDSAGGEAGMAKIGMVLYFAFFACIGFIGSVVVRSIICKIKNNDQNKAPTSNPAPPSS